MPGWWLLDAAVAPLSIAEANIGLPWNWRIGPASVAAGDPINLALAFTHPGAGCGPTVPLNCAAP